MKTTLKQKTCKTCKSLFMPMRPMAVVCSPLCGLELARTKREKAEKVAKVADRRETKVKLAKMKTRGDWIKEAQTSFNAYIRARDTGMACICCGRTGAGQVHGGEWDAGHYRSRGSAPHLRFDERNVHAQLKQCNRYASGNVAGYRVGLIERIGLEAVEALEADQASRDYTIADLQEIKTTYAARARELRKAQE